MKFSSSILLYLILVSCNQNNNNADNQKSKDKVNKISTVISPSKIEEKIYNIIYSLPEVKERAKYIEKETKGIHHLKVWINQRPEESNEKYYWIKVGEDNGTNLVTNFNFFVDTINLEVKYLDITTDKIISLESWRKETRR